MFMLLGMAATAQVELKINAIGALFSSPDLSVEFGVAPNVGVEVGLGLNFGKISIEEIDLKRNGLTQFVAGKYYFNDKQQHDGFNAGLYLSANQTAFKAEVPDQADENFRLNNFAIGFIAGQKWVGQNNIIFEIDLGLGRALINEITYEEEDATIDLSSIPFVNIDLLGRVAIGYRF
ncbi:MAG: DUF3575 domain-containing protein [Saprospiraceae bacterium]|nr:DUF3575 domain-containing protein [Saprospiraceae bacterium]